MRVHIESAGEGQALLFIHAGVADSRMWTAQLDEFASTHRVIAFDQRGYGKTPWEPGPYSDRDDALGVLDQLGVESAIIIGCSLGAGAALELAIDHADRVDGLVLVGAFPSGWVPEAGWEENPLEAEAEAAADAGDFERVVEIDRLMWLVGYGRSESSIDPAMSELFVDMDSVPVTTDAQRWEHRTPFGKKLNDHLADIDAPTLVIVGSHDEPLLVEAADYLAQRLSSQAAIVVESAAHLPSMEQPERFNEALRAFLDTV